MELARESDEQLMQRVAAGQREPLSILLRRYANPLLTFIRRMNCDHHKSEDLFQEVFLAVWSSRRRYRFPRPFRSWLFGMAVNKCRAEFRSRYEHYFSVDSPELAATNPGPTEGAIAVETATLMEQAVMRLPPQQRSVVVLRVWNDFTYREIAKVLNRTESTIRSNMFHALESLRKYLAPRMQYRPSDSGKE